MLNLSVNVVDESHLEMLTGDIIKKFLSKMNPTPGQIWKLKTSSDFSKPVYLLVLTTEESSHNGWAMLAYPSYTTRSYYQSNVMMKNYDLVDDKDEDMLIRLSHFS
jgi:hypothetical protein